MVSSKSSRTAKSYRHNQQRRNRLPWLRNLILIIILAATATIVTVIIMANISKPENQITSRISALASDYYESTFYENLISSDNYSGNPADALSKYTDYGLSPITLRQLLLNDQVKTAEDANYLLEYCDENRTSVKFYPESPYSRTDYHVEYTYSCEY